MNGRPTTADRIAVVLPSYNEGRHVCDVIATLPEWVWRVYVIDDCSTDDTAACVAPLLGDRVHYICHEVNSGVGGAMRTGYGAALADGASIVVKMDADGQMDPADLANIVEPIRLGMAEYVKGNRFRVLHRAKGMPNHRRFGNVAMSFANKVASGYWHVFDPQCGYTAIAAPALESLDLTNISRDYFFENDMLCWLNTLGARVVDVPVATVYGDEVSHIKLSRIIATFPGRLIDRYVRRVWRRHFVFDFGAVGMLLLAGTLFFWFGLIFGGYHWWLSIATDRVASTGTVMIAVLPLILGFQLLLQALLIEIGDSPGANETREFQRYMTRLRTDEE